MIVSTRAFKDASRFPQPNANGWYVFRAGELARCPGPAHCPNEYEHCGAHIGEVIEGEMWVRDEMRREVGERRQHPRFVKICRKNKGGCGSRLEIESRPSTSAAA